MKPGLDTDMIINPPACGTGIADIFTFLQQTVLYDGFPTFLPCKMIMQNPNISNVTTNWLNEFRSIDDDWTNLNNDNYWKLISKVVGNINIDSWNGDINIKTKGTLGNAGNINLIANNKYGALPGYKAGNVNIDAHSPFRIFTDPRDLFLDTHLIGKLTGQFAWFSSTPGQPPALAMPTPAIKPFMPVQLVLNFLRNSSAIWFC